MADQHTRDLQNVEIFVRKSKREPDKNRVFQSYPPRAQVPVFRRQAPYAETACLARL